MQGFQFKQFFIEHQRCAMKVGTDGILLGSWADASNAQSILDIGTGSGLLAIMLAQKIPTHGRVIGIDSQLNAIEQARINAMRSPWPEKLEFQHVKVQDYFSANRFEMIISNPPFFIGKSGDLETNDPQFISQDRAAARHTLGLTLADLFHAASRLLAVDGDFYCVLPASESEAERVAMNLGLYCHRQTVVFSVPNKPAIRHLFRFSKTPQQAIRDDLTIYSTSRKYTSQYKQLCQEFYLNF